MEEIKMDRQMNSPEKIQSQTCKNKDLTGKNEMSMYFKEWALRTTINGLPHLVRSHRVYQKLIWSFIILTSFSLCAFMISKSIMQYFEYSVTSRFRVESENEMVFPAISICNVNPWLTIQAYEYIKTYYEDKYSMCFEYYQNLSDGIRSGQVIDDTDWLLYRTYDLSEDDSYRKSFGYDIREIITYCSYESLACDLDHFEWYYSPYYGNCYKYNSGRSSNGTIIPLKTVKREGDGLLMELFIGYSDLNFVFLAESAERGISILIEDQKVFPLQKRGIFAKTGAYASVIVNKKTSNTLPFPYSNCLNAASIDTLLSSEMKKLGLEYNHRNCLDLCEQKQNIDELGCYDLRLPKILNATPCNNKTSFSRLAEMIYDGDECTKLCPFECETITYDLFISYAGYPSKNHYYDTLMDNLEFFTDFFGQEPDFDLLSDSLIPISIYFDSLTTTKIDETASIDIVNLIANIGCTIGLFIGASVITFGELFLLLFNLFLSAFETKRLF